MVVLRKGGVVGGRRARSKRPEAKGYQTSHAVFRQEQNRKCENDLIEIGKLRAIYE